MPGEGYSQKKKNNKRIKNPHHGAFGQTWLQEVPVVKGKQFIIAGQQATHAYAENHVQTPHHSLAICANTYQHPNFPHEIKRRPTIETHTKKRRNGRLRFYYFSLSFLFATVTYKGTLPAGQFTTDMGPPRSTWSEAKFSSTRLNKPPPTPHPLSVTSIENCS